MINDYSEGVDQKHRDANAVITLFNDQDQGYGDVPCQQVLQNRCVRHYNSRNASKVHGEHLGQGWVCGQEVVYMFTFPYFGMRLVRVS